jgi:hypothetical protein
VDPRPGLVQHRAGLAELLAPRAVARVTGMRRDERLLRAYGLRQIVAGVGLLTAKDPEPWLWARVGGDALDLATLAAGGRPRDASTAASLAVRRRRGRGRRRRRAPWRSLEAARAARCATTAAAPACRERSRDMRGAARADFDMPADMATPSLLRAARPS